MKVINDKKETLHHRSLQIIELLFGVLFPLFVFIVIGVGIWMYGSFNGEVSILRYIHHFATPHRDSLMVFLTTIGGVRYIIPVAVIIALFLAGYKRLREAGFLLLATGGAAVLNVIIKSTFHRARPHFWLSPAPEFDFGFPSGHSMMTMALVIALVVLLWHTRWRWCAIIAGGTFVLAVGLSRLYLGVHYPSDVLAGWSVSMAWVLGNSLYWGQRKFTVFVDREKAEW